MKKLFIFLLSLLSLGAFAQKPKLAVYMTGDDPINEIVSNRLVDDLARSNEFTTVERTSSFLAALSKEHSYERSGEVNDEQIASLGKQFNVQYVCVASVLDVWGGEKYITARIIDAETAEVIASGSSNGSMQSSSELINALNTLSQDFLKAMHYNKQSNAKKVAVYVTKTGNRDVDIVLGDQLVAGFAKSGRYAAIERTGGFLQKIKEEQGYQQSGAVDDNDLTRLGKQFGVNYVCVVKTTAWAGDYFISTRMIDVKTGEVVNTNRVEGAKLGNSQNVVKVAQNIASELSKGTFAERAEEARLKAEEVARIKAEREAQLKAEREAQLLKERLKQERIDNRKRELKAMVDQGYITCCTYKGEQYMVCIQPMEVTAKEFDAHNYYSRYGYSDWYLSGWNEIFFGIISYDEAGKYVRGEGPAPCRIKDVLNEIKHYYNIDLPIIGGHCWDNNSTGIISTKCELFHDDYPYLDGKGEVYTYDKGSTIHMNDFSKREWEKKIAKAFLIRKIN